VDKRKIQLDEPIKTIGEYQVPIRLHKDVTVPIKVVVEAEPESA
jgi:large subunit ribosomal protein L9